MKKKVKCNFELYLRVYERMQFIGSEPIVIDDPNGVTALEAFDAKDSQGKDIPCREGDTLRKVLCGKASLNLSIKMWSQGVAEGLYIVDEFIVEFDWLPNWVWDAVRNQAVHKKSRDGFSILDPEVRKLRQELYS